MVGLVAGSYLRYQADMDVAEILPLHLELELPEGLNKRHALYVSDCTAQLLAHNGGLNTRHMHCTHVSAHYVRDS